MPELPEVETVRVSLAEQLLNGEIQSVRINHPDVILYPPPDAWEPLLVGARLTGTGRRGKFLFMRWRLGAANGNLEPAGGHDFVLLVHLRMTGRLVVAPAAAAVVKHTHVQFGLNGRRELRFIDPRRFGRIALVPLSLLGPLAREAGLVEAMPQAAATDHFGAAMAAVGWDTAAARAALPPGLWQLGPEPLSAKFTAQYLATILQDRRAPIKALLMDQRLLAGLGNIYVDEALYRAGIHPTAAAGRVDPSAVKRLHRAIRHVLREGITHRGTTLSDYRDAADEPGSMGSRLLVFRREGEPCKQCRASIEKIRVAGRGTHFCPRCQAVSDT